VRPASYVLRARFCDGRTQTLHIRSARTVVGAGTCDIVVSDDLGVSEEHAEILFRDGMVGVRDLGSTNGTWVGGKRVERAVLRPSRGFRVGRTEFELVDVHQPSESVEDSLMEVRGGHTDRPIVDVSVIDRNSPRALPPAPVRRGVAHDEGPTTVVPPTARSGPPPVRQFIGPRLTGPAPVTGRFGAPVGGPRPEGNVGGPATDPPRAPQPAAPVAQAAANVALAVAGPEDPIPVLVAEADPSTALWLRDALSARFSCTVVRTGGAVLRGLEQQPRVIVIVGRQLADMSPDALVSALGDPSRRDRVALLAAEGIAPTCDRIFYRLRPGLSAADLLGIVEGAARSKVGGVVVPISGTRAWSNRLVFDICAAVSARPDSAAASVAVEEGMAKLMPLARAMCAFYDADSGLVWTESSTNPIETVATSGIIGFVARTGQTVHAPTAGTDPRYDRAVDNPTGSGHEAILAVPAAGQSGEVHAVLVAIREPTQGPFDDRACEVLAHLGREVGPVLHRLGAAVEAQQVLDEQGPRGLQLFRPEAVEAYRERTEEGDVIRVAPGWSRTMYWALLGMLIVGVLGISVGTVSQYSAGPAVVKLEGRSDVFAPAAGAVEAIEVAPGERVREGQVLARLTDTQERANYDATRADFHTQLRNRLLDPTDEAAASQSQALRRQLDAAAAALEQRVLRAPRDGVVTDIGVDAGQHVDVGNSVMAVVDDSIGALELVAFLPGGDRPQIAPGMAMRLELDGFDYAYQDLVVLTVSEGVVGPHEAKRLLGEQLADTLPIANGGVVMVRAQLASPTFESDGNVYPYHDGMGGKVEVRLRDETILEMLIPALKEM
jgi:multidrug efflux pump subunit AcrA (membrane-fusion protein)